MREVEFQASEVILNCVEGPATGPPILLLHGLFDRWQILLPVLLLSGESKVGAAMTDNDVEYACSRLDSSSYVLLEGVGHDLGLCGSNTEPLLRSVNQFLESL